VELHRVAVDAHTFHHQLVLRDGLLAAVASLAVAWATPDVGDAVERKQMIVRELGSDVET
jgi:hypothetical protein